MPLSPFFLTFVAAFVVLAVVMLAVAVLGPWGAEWLYGRLGGRLEPVPAQPDALAAELAAQIGKRGVARRMMAPSGQVQVEGRAYEAVSEGSAIEAGQPVVVVKVATRRLVVRSATA